MAVNNMPNYIDTYHMVTDALTEREVLECEKFCKEILASDKNINYKISVLKKIQEKTVEKCEKICSEAIEQLLKNEFSN
jgi:hypothetical protein